MVEIETRKLPEMVVQSGIYRVEPFQIQATAIGFDYDLTGRFIAEKSLCATFHYPLACFSMHTALFSF